MRNFQNLILIAGAGRNVGKTWLACKIIEHISKATAVIAIKISSHLHEIEEGQKIIANTAHYQIIEECLNSTKDSSRMRKAGAKRVFYIQTKQENLEEAFDIILNELTNYALICESGGLHEIVQPGLFFYVYRNEIPDNKNQILKHNPMMVNFSEIEKFDLTKIIWNALLFSRILFRFIFKFKRFSLCIFINQTLTH